MLAFKGGLIITTGYTAFILWAALMIIAFLFKNGWKVWGIYLLCILLLGMIIYFNK